MGEAHLRDDFIGIMLRMHHANSSRKWRFMVKNAKMEKSDLTLSTFVQYIEDFRFWVTLLGELIACLRKNQQKWLSLIKNLTYSVKKSTQEVMRRCMKLWTNQELNYQLIEISCLGDHRSCEKGGCEERKEGSTPFSCCRQCGRYEECGVYRSHKKVHYTNKCLTNYKPNLTLGNLNFNHCCQFYRPRVRIPSWVG